MSPSDIATLQAFWEARQPLVDECKAWIALSHNGDPWPDFRTIGCDHNIARGWIEPKFLGVPTGSVNLGGGDGPDRPTLVELAARTTQVRSRRWDGEKVKPLPDAWGKIVQDTFPFLTYFQHGKGWGDLIIAASTWIAETGDVSDWKSTDIKEKYGSLRWYWSGEPADRTADIMEAAEWISHAMCESCGAPGRQRGRGWITTLCDAHARGDE